MKLRKRESILNTAKHMFSRYGIRKTNLSDIARMAKVAKATIYNYFGSKEQVYLEVLNREANEFVDKLMQTLSQIKSPLEKLRFFYRNRLIKLRDNQNLLNLYEGNEVNLSQANEIRESIFKRELSILQGILEEGVKEGIFRIDNIFQAARMIGYTLRGWESSLLQGKKQEDLEVEFDSFFDILCRGILIEKKEG